MFITDLSMQPENCSKFIGILLIGWRAEPKIGESALPGVTTNSAAATNCVSLYDLKGIH